MPRDLAGDANENLREAFVRLADHVPDGETRQFGPLAVTSADVPIPLFNRVFVYEPPPSEEFAAAVEWMGDRDLPYWVTATDPAVDAVEPLADEFDLVKAGTQPGMALPSLDEIPEPSSVVDVVEVTDPTAREEFSAVSSSVFGIPPDVAERVDSAALEMDGVRSFLGRVDGDPAACGTLIPTEDVAGVYTIGVAEDFRRRGIGEAMSWEVLRAGREAGCSVGVLQSSEMAYPIYERMGYETVVTYHLFEPAT